MKDKANLLDYLEWRGDLSFESSPLCEVDALILCQLSYLNLNSFVSPKLNERISIELLWEKFHAAPDFEQRKELGAFISGSTVSLLEQCAKSERFGKIEACAYTSKIDLENEEQFSAVTFLLPPSTSKPKSKSQKIAFVAFRGTDDNIIGWKEDFNLALKTIVPSQYDALEYLLSVAKSTRAKIFVGGHSKGGNLATFSAAYIDKRFRSKIERVYNFDGPGFSKQVVQSEPIQRVVEKLRSFYPKSSVVGMLFRRVGEYSVVQSDGFGLMQHDPFAWHVKARGFETIGGFEKTSELFYNTFNEWLENASLEQRAVFVETLFTVISASGARTNTELSKNWFKNSIEILKAITQVDKETREEISLFLKHLFDTAVKQLIINNE